MATPFVHLHLHTRYSKADGSIDIVELAKKLKSTGMTACAITDHGVMYGAVPFYNEMTKQGIKPIIGYESYTDEDNAHLILLAKNNKGFLNLIKICSLENNEGFKKAGKFAKGNLDLDRVATEGWGEGIIASTACLGGVTTRLLLKGDRVGAEAYVRKLQSIFDEVYIELQDNSTKEQAIANMELQALAQRLNTPMIITKDAHYLNQEDWEAHDALLAKQVNKNIDDPDRWRFPGGPDYFVCTPDEMEKYCLDHNLPLELMTNTAAIADKCNIELFGKNGVYNDSLFPDYDEVPYGYTQASYLKELAMNGLIEFIMSRNEDYRMDIDKYIERLNYELKVIEGTGFTGYFLILWDFMKYCKQYRDATHPNGIGTGSGRGSGVGSLVCRVLDITKVDPIKYDLLFERFLNPERKSAPDVDLDISDEDRPLVIEYLKKKWGVERVAQIVTFTQLKVAGGTRDLMRLKGHSKKEQDEVCKLIDASFPNGSATSAKKLLDLYVNPDEYKDVFRDKFDGAYNQAKKYQEVVKQQPWVANTVAKLEGSITSSGVHAGGVLLFPGDATNYAPIVSSDSSKAAVLNICQYDMGIIDQIQALKIDVLGLVTSRVISKTSDQVGIDIDNINYEDQKVFQMLRDGNTVEVFQFEGGGMTKALMDSKVNSIEDLIALVSLYRPGPLDANDPDTGMTIYNTYINCCQTGMDKPVHPRLSNILSTSKGNIIYQEQIMQVVMEMGNCTLGYADIVRRAMGKKKRDLMAKMKMEFMYGLRVYDKDQDNNDVYNINNDLVLKDDGTPIIIGAVNNGFSEKESSEMWDVIEVFAGYAFNKSHAAAYAINAYQTAYLKYYYPAEFMANALTACGGEQDDIVKDIREAKRLGVPLLPPDVNKSNAGFTVEVLPDGRKAIRFGLGAIKNISSINAIVEQRDIKPFHSVADFFDRVSGREINRTKAENIILSGGFDSIEPNRHAVYNYYFGTIRKEKITDQATMDQMKADKDKKASAMYVPKNMQTFCDEDKYTYEKQLMNMYISGHPLDKYPYIPWVSSYIGESIECYGVVKNIRIQQDKNQRAYAFFTIETLEDIRDAVMWSTDFAKYGDRLEEGKICQIRGVKKTNQRGEAQMVVNQIMKKAHNAINTPKAQPNIPLPVPIPVVQADPLEGLFLTS